MADYVELTEDQTDAKSPVDEALARGTAAGGTPVGGWRGNFENHEDRLTALEGAGGAVSPLAFKGDPLIAKPLIGFEDNVGEMIRSKYSIFSGINAREREFINAYDLDGSDPNVMDQYLVDQDTATLGPTAVTDSYRGTTNALAKNGKRGFKKKKGWNALIIYADTDPTLSDSLTLVIDDAAINTSPFVDENGDAHSGATFSTAATAVNFKQSMVLFVGNLDPDKEQWIVLENTDSGSKTMHWTATEVLYIPPISTVAIAHDDTRLSAGQAVVRGSKVSVTEADLSFTPATGYGRLDAVAISTSGGAPTILEGAQCAMSQIRAKLTVTDTDTTSELKTSFFFSTKGIFHYQFPYGNGVIGSFTGKTETLPEAHSLDGVIFESKFEDIVVEDDFASAALGDAVGNITVNLLADGSTGVTVSASNNKLDFTIGQDGLASADFAATITNGFYTADLFKLGDAIVQAMDAAKTLPDKQTYFAEYDPKTYLWSIGVRGRGPVDTFSLLFSSGANFAASIHSSLGFSSVSDKTGSFSYIATVEKQHLATRCFDRGRFQNPFSPNCKYSAPRSVTDIEATTDDIKGRWGIGHVVQIASNQLVNIYPDPDSVGCEFSMIMNQQGSIATISIDNAHSMYMMQTERAEISGPDIRTTLITAFVTYPRGTHKVTIRQEEASKFEVATAVVNDFMFAGFRELFSHPPLEKLTSSQAALPWFYKIRPKVLFCEPYAANYVPQSNEFEKIDTITYDAAWTTTVSTGNSYNNEFRQTTVQFTKVDITFTIDGNCGGFGVHVPKIAAVAGENEIQYFLTTGTSGTSAAANLITQDSHTWDPLDFQQVETFRHVGLPNGQYTVRVVKNSAFGTLKIDRFNVYDDVESDPDASVVSELTNDDRGLSYPDFGVIHQALTKDGLGKIPASLFRTGYKDGEATHDTRTTGIGNYVNLDDESASNVNGIGYFDSYAGTGTNNTSYLASFAPCEVMWTRDSSTSVNPTNLTPEIDGRDENSTYNQRIQVKAGNAMSAGSFIDAVLFKKNFFRFGSGNMSDSTTFLLNDTRGIRLNQKVRVTADGETTVPNRIIGITLDTDVTLAREISAFANFTTANNTALQFQNFHRILIQQKTAILEIIRINSFSYLPFAIGKSPLRDLDEIEGEQAVAFEFDLSTGDDLPVPFYLSDGMPASWSECDVTILRNSNGGSVNFANGFFGIILGASTVIDVKITATRGRK